MYLRLARILEKFHAKLLKNLFELFKNKDFIEHYCFDNKSFTRNRLLPFQTVVLLILQLLKSSVSTELKSFFTTLNKVDEVVNWVYDSSFCKARQKIKHQLFKHLNDVIIRFFYAKSGVKKCLGFRVLAVDGSEINLPPSKELLRKYGHHHTNSIGTKTPQARVSFLYDVLNSITIDAQLRSFKIGEQHMLKAHYKHLRKGDLLTADANYGHFRLLKAVLKKGTEVCFRMSQSTKVIQDFLASGEKDIVLEWRPSIKTKENCKEHKISPAPLQVRLVRIDLSDNETEVLALSLLDKTKYSFEDIKRLYNMRWGIEEEFKKFMQRLQIEFFSSLKRNGILQDFHANIFMQNLVSILIEPVKKRVNESSQGSKHHKKVNWTAALGDVRKRVVLLFVRPLEQVYSIIKSMWESFKKNTEAIKPDRKFPRDKRKKGARQKCFMSYKSPW